MIIHYNKKYCQEFLAQFLFPLNLISFVFKEFWLLRVRLATVFNLKRRLKRRLDRSDQATFARKSGITFTRKIVENVYIFKVPGVENRASLVQKARQLKQQNSEEVDQVGLVVVPISLKDLPVREPTPMIISDEFIANFKPNTARDQIEVLNQRFAVEIVMENPFRKNQFLLRITENTPAISSLEIANSYNEQKNLVEYAHPNFVQVLEFRANQWPHNNDGTMVGSVADADMDTLEAKALVPAASSVVIAVIDDGFDMTHPDLATNYWSNPSELAGSAGSDDDGNGFIDDINGWNFTTCFSPSTPCGNNNLNPGSGDKHGTALVGVVAANGSSYAAVTGSCPNCKVMPLRLSSSSTNYSQALAFDYAIDMNANIIVSSWGYISSGPTTTVVKNAIEDAAINNAVFFAMNDSNVSDCSSSTSSLTNVIAISSSTNSDTFANTGYGNCMDLLAPSGLGATTTDVQGNKGINTASTAGSVPPTCGILEESNQNYTNCFSGTSFSSALTAGVAGLILSVKPGLTRDQVQKLLQDTADKIDPVAANYDPNTGRSNSNRHGWGRVNAFEAVRTVAPTEKNGVDIFLRDNDLDWGNTAQSSFPTPVQSRDIKIDALPYRVSGPPTTGIEFDSFISEPLNPGNVNKVYVRVHNRGTDTANTVTVKLYQAKAVPGGILPNLPATFWNASYMSYTNANPWYPLNCAAASPISPCIISNLQYSGSSVASTSNDTAQIVTFDFSVPANPEKFFLLAIVDSPQDPVASSTKTKFDVNDLTPRDNNVTYFSYNLLATIRSQTTGNWNNPATWSVWNGTTWQPGIRIPLNTDRVLVQNGHKVFVTSAKITIDSLYNQGQIWGQNGTNGSGTSAGEVQHATGGGNVWLTVENLLFNGNNGRIRAGRGGDGMYSWPPHIPTKGGTGGNIRIETNHDLINYGTIGPDAMQLSPRRSWKCLPNYPIPQLLPTGDVGGNGGTGHHWNENDNDRSGGNGGSTTVAGVNINNQGRIAAGHGGNAQEHDDCVGIPLLQAMPRTTPAEISAFEAALSNLTSIKAGLGGIATITPSGSFTGNGKIDGNGGSIWIEPTILINGREVHIYNSQNITIFGGDDATLALNDLRDEAIEATETITLAVGEGGIVDLRGNASKVLKAGASVKIFADTVLLNEGVTLQDLIDAPIIETYPHKILYHVTLHTPNQVNGIGSETLPVDIIVSNGGPTVDTYTLTVTDSASWQLGTLPNTITVEGLDSTELELNVTLPKVIEATDTITVTATSQQDPSISATVEIVVAVKDPTALPAPDDTLSNTDDIPSDTVDNQVPESDIFTSVEAALDWLEANNLSPEDLTKEQLDALPITWQDPTAVEPLTPPEPEPIPEPELTTTQLDEMEQVLVAINRKDVLEQAEVESLDKLSEDLLVIAQTIAQNYQDASQAALDQQRIDPLTNFEAQLKPLQDRITTIAILAQNAMERVQIGEMFLSPELVNNLSDEELASFLGNQGLKAHTAAGIISTERSQAISKLGIPALNLDILDFSNSCLSTPISSLDSVLDLFFPKAEAAAVLSCVAICASKGFGSACVNCIVSKGINVTNKLKALINEWKRCKKERWWKRWWCRTKVIAKIIYYVG